MDWECGGRDKATCERLLKRLTRWRTRLSCADDYAVYGVLLPVGQLYTSTDETHGIERDNAAWHVSQAVQAWIGAHNRTVKRTGGVRILVCRLPVKSPWLNPIEPRWLHGKRAIVEPERTLTAHELMDRAHQHFRCECLEPLHQHVR